MNLFAARLLIVLWLPFCCCQLQGAWAMVGHDDATPVASGCGGGCCDATPDRGDDPDPVGDSDGPCAASCCVRGETVPTKWELPAGRLLEVVAGGPTAGGNPLLDTLAGAHHDPPTDPPWSRPTGARIRLQV